MLEGGFEIVVDHSRIGIQLGDRLNLGGHSLGLLGVGNDPVALGKSKQPVEKQRVTRHKAGAEGEQVWVLKAVTQKAAQRPAEKGCQ